MAKPFSPSWAAALCYVFTAVLSGASLQGPTCAALLHINADHAELSSSFQSSPSSQYSGSQHLNTGVKGGARLLRDVEPHARRPRLILHLGPHKTGTSYFQSGLSALGGLSPSVEYPHTCGRAAGTAGYISFAKLLCYNISQHDRHGCDPHHFPEALDLTEGRDIILSAETFDGCLESGFEKVQRLFPQYDVHVVLVHRRSGSLLLSNYHQLNKWSSEVPHFEKWRETYTKNYRECRHATLACVQLLVKVFGAEHVHVISYEGMHEAGTSLEKVLCERFSDTECYDFASVDHKGNVSPYHLAYSTASLYNRLHANTSFSSANPFCVTCRRQREAFIRDLRAAGVQERCFHSTVIPHYDTDCDDECFRQAMMTGTYGINSYLFEESGSYQDTTMHCEFLESSALDSPDVLSKVLQAAEVYRSKGVKPGRRLRQS